jgi:serine/threonine-protein kinase HipA
MAINGKFAGITRADLLVVANRFGIGTASKILKLVGEAVAAWPDFAAQAGVSEQEVKRIIEHQSVL